MSRRPRPAPRRSSLAGHTPAAPPPDPPAPAAAPAVPAAAAPAEQADARSSRAPSTGEPPRQRRHKVSFYQDPTDTSRVRAAVLHTQVSEGTRTLSEFIHRAVMAEVKRLEAKYNAGVPWPGLQARELPQGRPIGS